MPDKYIKQDGGRLKEQQATVQSTGVAEAGDIVALDNTGHLDESVLPVGVGAEIKIIEASEALMAGNFVNIHDPDGLKVRKAVADSVGTEAHGFVKEGCDGGDDATVYCVGINDQLTGLEGGPRMYLSAAAAGAATNTAPAATGNVVQMLGWRLSDTELSFQPQNPIELA